MKHRALPVITGLALSLVPAIAAAAPREHDGPEGGDEVTTFAVYGDSPYGTKQSDTAQLLATPGFIDSINADPDVTTVVHVGDIHSGKQWCTEAYDREIARQWTRFADPLVYTPGDNEWADCHKAGEGGGTYNATTQQIDFVLDPVTQQPVDYASGNPAANLQLIRSIFFAEPGATLGGGDLHVFSQAQFADRAHPEDRAFVENVMWREAGVEFVTLDIPGGSNNDADRWYGAPLTPEQIAEAPARDAANLRWLDRAFATATKHHARGVVIIEQADMWDIDGKPVAHVANYEPYVASIAAHTLAFGKPVLMFNGDSHSYRSDNPLLAGAPCVTEMGPGAEGPCSSDDAASHPGYDVPNFHRIVVHGSTMPLEWLKLQIHEQPVEGANAFGPFSWTRQPQS